MEIAYILLLLELVEIQIRYFKNENFGRLRHHILDLEFEIAALFQLLS